MDFTEISAVSCIHYKIIIYNFLVFHRVNLKWCNMKLNHNFPLD